MTDYTEPQRYLYIQAYTHTEGLTHRHTHTQMHENTHTYIYTHTEGYTHIDGHTYTQTHMLTQTLHRHIDTHPHHSRPSAQSPTDHQVSTPPGVTTTLQGKVTGLHSNQDSTAFLTVLIWADLQFIPGYLHAL
jgi:hypothetical protein